MPRSLDQWQDFGSFGRSDASYFLSLGELVTLPRSTYPRQVSALCPLRGSATFHLGHPRGFSSGEDGSESELVRA